MSFDLASEVVRIHGAREVARSPGTRPILGDGYRPDAKIPREPWSLVTRTTAAPRFAAADDAWEHRRDVAIVALPQEIIATVQRIGVHNLNEETARLQLLSCMTRSMLENALRLADRFSSPGSAIASLGWRVQVANTPTLTIDKRTSYKTGLHVDSWDSAPLEERGNARNRLCMNLGQWPRYFLFIDLTLHGIWEILSRPQISAGGGLGQLFLERYPDYPVTRLRVEPGYAYIAPTENLLHDGAAAAQGVIDISYTLLGRFQCMAFE